MAATRSVDTVDISYSLNECLFAHALTNPTHDAVVTPTIRLSYLELSQLVKAQVKVFNDIEISDHSVIGIQCADEIQHLVLCLAAAYIGCTSCTIPTYETDQARNSIINNCGATIIVDESLAVNPTDQYINNESKLKSSASARLLFSTSGTTGNPKLVVHHDQDLVAQSCRHVNSKKERFLCLASIEHNFAKRHRLYCVAMGATNIFIDANQDSFVEQCQSLNVNVIHVSAFQAQELLAIPNISELTNIRLKLGGSHVDYLLRNKLRNGITENLQAGYGTTETGAIAFTDPNDREDDESVGLPLPGIEVRVVTHKKKALSNGEQGEIIIRCHGMFREYLGNLELTNNRIRDGWFYTGDIGYIDDKHRIHLCGRSDDMFVFNSMNIYPQEIESQIREYPSIADVAVLPKSSSSHGNIPVALIVFDKNIKPKLPALKKYVKKKIGVRSPRQYIIVDEIPRNTVGKIARSKVTELSSKSEDIRECIIQALGERGIRKFKPSFITALIRGETDIKLNKFELDSLARMNLLVALEVSYEVIITPAELTQFRYFGHLVARVLSIKSHYKQVEIEKLVSSKETCNEKIKKSHHHIVNLLRRVLNYCNTVTQFNKVLGELANRITPLEVEMLRECNNNREIIPESAADKYHSALNSWLKRLVTMMSGSGKIELEKFVLRRISPYVKHFIGRGLPSEKTLVVCFAGQGGGGMMMPSAVLLQHTNALNYDLLVISEPLNKEYRYGVPYLGNNPAEVIEWVANFELIKSYGKIRTFGCSAGGYLAVIAGYRLGAELVVSVGARFHKITQPIKYLQRITKVWHSAYSGNCSCVLMTYVEEDTRDQHCAKIISLFTGGSRIAVECNNASIGHHMLRRLASLGLLSIFLKRTIFSEMNGELIDKTGMNAVLSLPENTIHIIE